jgi:hypothetical protein
MGQSRALGPCVDTAAIGVYHPRRRRGNIATARRGRPPRVGAERLWRRTPHIRPAPSHAARSELYRARLQWIRDRLRA